MRRLIRIVQSGRADKTKLLTHRFSLEDITEGYQLFGSRADNVLKVAVSPAPAGLGNSRASETVGAAS
jgi:threonine dehydrogenase-like Zn-dependent dehydrogenase